VFGERYGSEEEKIRRAAKLSCRYAHTKFESMSKSKNSPHKNIGQVTYGSDSILTF